MKNIYIDHSALFLSADLLFPLRFLVPACLPVMPCPLFSSGKDPGALKNCSLQKLIVVAAAVVEMVVLIAVLEKKKKPEKTAAEEVAG